MTHTFIVQTPPAFRFWPTVRSHGWCDLGPFSSHVEARTLERVHQLGAGSVVRLILAGDKDEHIAVTVEGLDNGLSPAQKDELTHGLTNAFNLDRDLSDFYALVRQYPRYLWIEQKAAGRMLAAPTVWEDLAKTLLTTNTTWNMTKQMVARLNTLGEPDAPGGHAFPTPERIAAMTPDDLNAHVRAGYRGAYLHELAVRIANGDLDVESWRDPALASADLYKRVKSLKGFGDYAAGSILKLLGHFDRLATDTECRAVYKEINNGVPAQNDAEIAAYYEPFGPWRGLVQWMDVMEGWLKNS
ncbi:MAG: 3-methyladenine DNA glycosylase [Anaerolineae bacterium]|nr:3-methyladenine DNA glycosylase [Anaerolineae bacterium]